MKVFPGSKMVGRLMRRRLLMEVRFVVILVIFFTFPFVCSTVISKFCICVSCFVFICICLCIFICICDVMAHGTWRGVFDLQHLTLSKLE